MQVGSVTVHLYIIIFAGTYDIQDVNMTLTKNVVKVSLDFSAQATASGALLIFNHSAKDTGLRLRTVSRGIPHSFDNTWPTGMLAITAFDIEGNGTLLAGKHCPAASDHAEVKFKRKTFSITASANGNVN